MSRKVTIAPLEFYHIYNRGTDKRDVFLNQKDYARFLSLLHLCNSTNPADLKLQGSTLYDLLKIDVAEPIVDIGAYCLMPNHFHLLMQERESGGISKFMQKVITGYTMYFNKKNERTGSLFQGRFKTQHADTDEYLKYLFSYIHLNPMKLKEPSWKETGIHNRTDIDTFLKSYRFSSYPDYVSTTNRLESVIINKNAFPDYFPTQNDLDAHLNDWLEFNPEPPTRFNLVGGKQG